MKPTWNEYYSKISSLPHRPVTETAVSLIGDLPKIAIDCGCGIGRDSDYLLRNGFEVHAFDVEQRAIDTCYKRFEGLEGFLGAISSFADFLYPKASIVLAHSSLFFARNQAFT